MNIAVFGGGSWATAIVKILLENHDKVLWWVKEKDIKESIENSGYNKLYLRSCKLDNKKLEISNDMHYIISKSDYLFFVIPSAFLESSMQDVTKEELKDRRIISAIKGIVPSTNEVVSNWFMHHFDIPNEDLAIISGPSHAEEISQRRLTYLTCASENILLAKEIAKIIECSFVKTVICDDVLGIEYGAVMKNIYALAAGIVKGMDYGDNFIAVLVSNAAIEMQRFLDAISPREREIKRLAYLGDLLVTAYSAHSRNRTFGQMIGRGYTVKEAQVEMNMIAEGYYSAQCVHKDNKLINCHLPIATAVYNILYKSSPKETEINNLMSEFI